MTHALLFNLEAHSVRNPVETAWSETCALPPSANRRAAFTLIELLSVVSIIAILLGIVLSAIETVHRYSRKAVAQVEVRAIEDAWKRYFDHYNHWPTNTSEGAGFLESLSAPDIYHTYRIDAVVGAAMEGRIDHDGDAAALNPDGIHLMEFSRYGQMEGTRRTPVNPWHRGSKLELEKEGDLDLEEDPHSKFFYYVRFDVNANNRTSLASIPGLPGDAETDAVSRSVIVWTYNPNDPEDFMSSWSR